MDSGLNGRVLYKCPDVNKLKKENITMKINFRALMRYFLVLILIAAVPLIMAACSSTPSPTPTATLSSITITPGVPVNLAVGSTQKFSATGDNSGNSTYDITTQVTWTSSNPAIATISSSGLATGIAPGSTTITASLSGVSSRAIPLTVIAGP
jgi:hypothetical protein